MKKILLISTLAAAIAFSAPSYSQEQVCKVRVCNKLERFTLDLGSMFMDKLGETCQDVIIEKHLAEEGKVLTSESRWYQGSTINPTKKSVTRVKEVYQCFSVK